MNDDDRWRLERRASRAALKIIHRASQHASSADRLSELKRGLSLLPEEIRTVVETLLGSQEVFLRDVRRPGRGVRRDRIGAAMAATSLVVGLAAIAIAIPTPTAFQERVFVVILALAAATVGAFLPGTIAVKGSRPSLTVRASGALGFGVFVLLVYRWLL